MDEGEVQQLVSDIQDAFDQRLDDDEFLIRFMPTWGIESDSDSDVGMRSMREFISTLAEFAVNPPGTLPRPPVIKDFDLKLGELLKMPVFVPGSKGWTVRILAQALMIEPMLHTLFIDLQTEANKRVAMKEATSLDVKVAKGWTPWESGQTATSVEIGRMLVNVLADRLEEKMGERTLRSFFVREPAPGRFLRWWPGADDQGGVPFKSRRVASDFGHFQVDISRFDTEDLPLRAYEWRSVLLADGGDPDKPLVLACGMAYAFERRSGIPLGGRSSLVNAADMVSDTDVMLVRAFLDQYGERANEIIDESDLAFVWLWERQPQAPKGAGLACLQAGLKALKRHSRRMDHVVLTIEPYQYLPTPDFSRPPVLEQEYLDTFDHLLNWGASLQGQLTMEVLLTAPRKMGPYQTLAYLGQFIHEDMAAHGKTRP